MKLTDRLAQHNMVVKGPLTHPFESMHMGNGDIGASVNIYPHEIKIILAKSDIADARSNANPEKFALKHDDLIKLVEEKDRDIFCIWEVGREKADYIVDSYDEDDRMMPEPKRAGCIRLFHPGLSDTYVESELQLADGVIVCKFHFAKGKLIVRAFVEKGANRVWMNVTAEGDAPWFVLNVEKEPDDYRIDMPLPVLKNEDNRLSSITQTIPGGFGIDEFSWTLAAKFPEKGDWLQYKAYRVRQYCKLDDGESAELCVAIATDRDGTDTLNRALKLATECDNYAQVFENHQEKWMEYWNRSNIELADKELESVWYRNHFGYACALGANPLGSAGNVLIQDSIPWNGDCHTNHNFQKWYCTAYATNHAEWMELYARFIREKLSIFEYQAQLLFGVDGAFVDISYFPFMAKEHCNVINFFGRALAVTGWMAAPLWHHYEYFKDVDWLRDNTYPFLKRAAMFYVNYMEKYSDETNEIWPSVRLEEPGFTKDFIGLRNVLTDLCMFKKTFERAIAAAEILGVDEDLREIWAKTCARVPEIEYGEDWISLDKHWPEVEPKRRADESRYSRWGGGGWIVYPGEHVQGDEEDNELVKTLRRMLSKTDPLNPFISELTGENMYPGVPVIHPISSLVPMIRLGLTEKFDRIREVLLAHRLTYGQAASYMLAGGAIPKEVNSNMGFLWYDWRSVENKYAGVLAINEMLLQSQGGVVRLFPFVPKDMDVAIDGFRAIGGFVVSAKRENGVVTAEILSELGEELKYKLPCGTVKTMPTEAGKVYTVTF